jgi:hypothetical protein
VTVAVLLILFGGNSKGSTSSDIWPVTLLGWMILALPLIAGLLWVVGVIVLCIERHQMHKRHRALGLPDPRPPWWPWAVVAAWAVGVFGVFISGSVIFWRIVYVNFESRSAALEPALHAASLDDSVQKLIRTGAQSTVITARVEQVAGVDGEIASLNAQAIGLVVGYGVVLLVVLAAFVVAVVRLYRRQVRRRARYDERVTASVTRAASLTL